MTDPGAFLVIVGPTATGKTALSLAVAEALDGEIVSMDSRQVYRGMDIGTAKATARDRARVPHHGLDLVDPDARYSAGRFARDARRWIEEIRARSHTPVLVGGTGFFLKALIEPMFAEPVLDERRRAALRQYLGTLSRERLGAWVCRLDPERAALAIEGGPHRVGRTLEVALLSGRPLSEWHRVAAPEHEALDGVIVLLELPREALYRRIDARTCAMVRDGLVEEVRALLDRGVDAGAPGMTGTGYREAAQHLAGKMDLDETVRRIAQSTRRYARRQQTWFRHQLPAGVPALDASAPVDEQVAAVLDVWNARREARRAKGKG